MDYEQQLLDNFLPHEVETTSALIRCMDKPPTAMKFRRIVMLLLRGHYSSKENYPDGYEHLGCYEWSDSRSSTLHVGLSGMFDDKKPDNYPGVYVVARSVEFSREAIGDKAGMSNDMGTTFLSRGATLTLDVMHVAGEINDAYDLAEMSAAVLTALGAPFALKSGARSFEVLGISEPKKETPSPDRHYAVAMTVKISYTQSVSRSVESHRIRRIAMELPATR
jgi:hypothetical protein